MAAILRRVEAEQSQHEIGSKVWYLTAVCALVEDALFLRAGGYAAALFFHMW